MYPEKFGKTIKTVYRVKDFRREKNYFSIEFHSKNYLCKFLVYSVNIYYLTHYFCKFFQENLLKIGTDFKVLPNPTENS